MTKYEHSTSLLESILGRSKKKTKDYLMVIEVPDEYDINKAYKQMLTELAEDKINIVDEAQMPTAVDEFGNTYTLASLLVDDVPFGKKLVPCNLLRYVMSKPILLEGLVREVVNGVPSKDIIDLTDEAMRDIANNRVGIRGSIPEVFVEDQTVISSVLYYSLIYNMSYNNQLYDALSRLDLKSFKPQNYLDDKHLMILTKDHLTDFQYTLNSFNGLKKYYEYFYGMSYQLVWKEPTGYPNKEQEPPLPNRKSASLVTANDYINAYLAYENPLPKLKPKSFIIKTGPGISDTQW